MLVCVWGRGCVWHNLGVVHKKRTQIHARQGQNVKVNFPQLKTGSSFRGPEVAMAVEWSWKQKMHLSYRVF